jgi:perosamine synthetase
MFWNSQVAYKYKMSSMQAALGLAQLARIEELVERKRDIFKWYQGRLNHIQGVFLNHEAPGTKNSYWMVTVIMDPRFGLEKEELIQLLGKENIDCRPFFYPLSSLPAYSNLEQARIAQKRNRTSYQISPFGINLPSGLNMTEEKVSCVCDALKSALTCRGELGL